MKSFSIATVATLAAFGLALAATSAQAADSEGSVQIVTALFGKESSKRTYNFTTRLQQTCGASANTCEVFCSEAFVGHASEGIHWIFTHHPVCRVVYRCGSDATRTAEAYLNETMDLDCRRPE